MLALSFPKHQIGLFQGVQMVGETRLGHGKMLRDLPCREIPFPQQMEYPTSGRIG